MQTKYGSCRNETSLADLCINIIYIDFKLLQHQHMLKQEIIANIKHKQRDFKVKIDWEEQIQKVVGLIANSNKQIDITPEQYHQMITDEKTNMRQKFKIYKRFVESKNQMDIPAKRFVVTFMKEIHIKEYIFGNTENKSILMNTLKKMQEEHSNSPLSVLQGILKEMPKINYLQSKNLLEYVDMVVRYDEENKNIQNDQPRQIFLNENVVNILLPVRETLIHQFYEGKKIIINDSYKLKWLQHFVDILRSMNIMVRLFKAFLSNDFVDSLKADLRQLIGYYKILTKEVLTQLYLMLLFINPDQPTPEQNNKLCMIHYLHASNIVKSIDILQPLMTLLPTIKDTQHKCQLLPILLKAFQTYYSSYIDKKNAFDQVINLFQVGRSIYSYLQQIITIIMRDSLINWSLEGNFIRKFFIATIALKNNVPTQIIFKQWPNVIRDVIIHSGNMIMPYASDCALILLTRIYEESGKDYKLWSQKWLPQYKVCLLDSQNRGQIRGVIQFINPILLSISPDPIFLQQILKMNDEQQNKGALLIGIISLLKCFKQLGKITVDNKNKVFVHSDDPTIVFTSQQIQELLLHLDSSVALKALQFMTVHLKSSQPMEPLELDLTIQFYKFSLKTSLPEYRKSYLNATKKMFERLRTVYENELTKSEAELKKNKRYKPKQYFNQFKIFLQKIITICYQNVFPDVIFQLANPALEILLLIGNYFGRDGMEIKKGQILQPSQVLKETSYFQQINFQNLLCCLQSSYQSVRLLAHQILRLFHDLNGINQLKQLWTESLINANKLTIKSYEYACRILAFISQSYSNILQLPTRYKLKQLNICQLFLNIVKERYVIFKQQFATQQDNYYKNLIHGILTVFSYTFDHLASSIRRQPEHFSEHFQEIKEFLAQFFEQMNQIILFSVEICSSNISTVVLDSLPQSQTDRKFKVDCRGHFLQQTSKNVGSFFESPALLTSMQNQEQGIENMLVVSFYLLTREAGLVFQSIGNLVGTSLSTKYIPAESLVQLVNTYFYALINLKHMGSVDRISNGLGKMAKVIFDNEDKLLNQLPEKLLQKLIVNLEQGNFTNILRRSAGVPYAFTCLLKSEALRRKQMIERTIFTLLDLSRQKESPSIELRIHSLNILKKLFQDGDLKNDLDPYVSAAFISSIKGFTSQEWGVRNSSLMLFSVLANRTVGIKPTFNLLQFFHRCPELLDFFTEQLQKTDFNTMYPPLYPIVLLLSRLLPFDLKDRPKMTNKGQLNLKQIRKQSLLTLLPLIEKAGINNNYMGRVMTAKAILPFMEINNIVPYCLNILRQVKTIQSNNLKHYQLTTCFQLFLSLQEITKLNKYDFTLKPEISEEMLNVLVSISQLIVAKQSTVVTQVLIKIVHHLLQYYRQYFNKSNAYSLLMLSLHAITKSIIKQYFSHTNLIIPFNMGESIYVKESLHLHIDLLYKYQPVPDLQLIIQDYCVFLNFLKEQVSHNPEYLKVADSQIIEYYLQKIVEFLDGHDKNQTLSQNIREVIDKLDMKQIASDNVLIEVIELRSYLQVPLSEQITNFLTELELATNNHFLKIAIFKYFQTLDCKHPFLLTLLQRYTKPEQLQQLRECCVEYLQVYPQVNEHHYIAYIRLLQDEQSQIRYQTAKILSRKFGLPQLNQEVVKDHILVKLTVGGFQQLLAGASDYDTKLKNNQQQRIFSYDKPNKYRSDISNIIYALLNNPTLLAQRKSIPSVIQKLSNQIKSDKTKDIKCIQKYIKDIINRNEYQFQTIVRLFFSSNPDLHQSFTTIFNSHPLLKRIIQLYPLQ